MWNAVNMETAGMKLFNYKTWSQRRSWKEKMKEAGLFCIAVCRDHTVVFTVLRWTSASSGWEQISEAFQVKGFTVLKQLAVTKDENLLDSICFTYTLNVLLKDLSLFFFFLFLCLSAMRSCIVDGPRNWPKSQDDLTNMLPWGKVANTASINMSLPFLSSHKYAGMWCCIHEIALQELDLHID